VNDTRDRQLLTGVAVTVSHSPDLPGPTSGPRISGHAVHPDSLFVALCGSSLSELPDSESSWPDDDVTHRCSTCVQLGA
jgi:hypothetical protein